MLASTTYLTCVKECVGITFVYIYISWDVMIMNTFISKLCSRTSKELSVEACWWSLTHNSNHQFSHNIIAYEHQT
jgi:hypothetical protein